MKTSPRLPLTALGVAALAFLPGCQAINKAIDRNSAEAPQLIKEKLPLRYYYGDAKGENARKQVNGKYVGEDGTVVFKDYRTRVYYLKAYDDAVGETEKQRVRGEIVFELMTAIDQGYQDHEKAFKAGFASKDVLLDSTHLAIDLAATVMVPAQTKTVLSAIATGLGGVNVSIDKNYFDQKSIEIVMLEMRSMRKTKADEITGNLKTQSISQYPLSAAMRALVLYYYCGSTTNALISLQAKAAQPADPKPPPSKPKDETQPATK